MSESIYRQMVAELAAAAHSQGRPKADIREEIVHYVEAALAHGEHWAKDVVLRWQLEGAARDYTKAHRALFRTTYIRRDGRRIRKTVSYSRPRRAADSGSVVAWVQMGFWDYDLAAMLDKRAELAAQGLLIAEIVVAFDAVIAAMRRHPEAKTAREAWLTDGRDLTEIQLAA